MRQVTRKGLITMAAAGGVLALSGGYAHADAGAAGSASDSPGVLSGNSVQIPVDVPVNVCGNSVSVVGLLNPTAGNACRNGSGSSVSGRHGSDTRTSPVDRGTGRHAGVGDARGDLGHEHGDGAGRHGGGKHRAGGGGATAEGYTHGSPGILSGNDVQAPVDIPVNACGNSITIGGLLNPTAGNSCENDTDVSTPPVPVTPVTPVTPPVTPEKPVVPGPREVPNAPVPQLAHTGAGGLDLLAPAGAGLLLAGVGTVLYRRSRMSA
ncbi:chaplin [Streptomyces sp. NPDC058231]|uniref:chaplin n=1 Tax=Streptomyces sp. NPDC058231 TaxID=3346392 RepID=UPI0036F0D238